MICVETKSIEAKRFVDVKNSCSKYKTPVRRRENREGDDKEGQIEARITRGVIPAVTPVISSDIQSLQGCQILMSCSTL